MNIVASLTCGKLINSGCNNDAKGEKFRVSEYVLNSRCPFDVPAVNKSQSACMGTKYTDLLIIHLINVPKIMVTREVILLLFYLFFVSFERFERLENLVRVIDRFARWYDDDGLIGKVLMIRELFTVNWSVTWEAMSSHIYNKGSWALSPTFVTSDSITSRLTNFSVTWTGKKIFFRFFCDEKRRRRGEDKNETWQWHRNASFELHIESSSSSSSLYCRH